MQYKAESSARQYAIKGSAYRSISAVRSASQLASSVGCHNPMSKCFFRKGHTALSSTRNKKICGSSLKSIMRIMTIIKIVQKVRNEVPQFCGRGLGPELTRFLGGKKINRHAILMVYWNISVQLTQIAKRREHQHRSTLATDTSCYHPRAQEHHVPSFAASCGEENREKRSNCLSGKLPNERVS